MTQAFHRIAGNHKLKELLILNQAEINFVAVIKGLRKGEGKAPHQQLKSILVETDTITYTDVPQFY